MRWSLSKHKAFLRCERQWYYKNILAHHAAKDEKRREAYLLKSLQTLDAWKGNIVDKIISEDIIPSIASKKLIDRKALIDKAGELLKKQYDFAVQQRHKEKGLTKTGNDEFLALYNIEYEIPIEESEKRRIWGEIKEAINNFMNSTVMLKYLSEANSLIPQPQLGFKKNGFSIEGKPDLLALFKNKPPHIFDWKAHHFGTTDANAQLNLYAICLKNTSSYHYLFDKYAIKDIWLTEFQLITNVIRHHRLSDYAFSVTEELISDSLIKIAYLKDADQKFDQLDISDFSTTNYESNCTSCPFKKLCWNEKCN